MTERLHYLDTLRAVMMVLGIAFHAGLIYSEHSNWIVKDAAQSEWITWITYWIHVFRMPAFFIVAGFFCAFLYARVNVKTFISTRLNRLGIPLVMTALTLNFAQYLIIGFTTGSDTSVSTFFLKGEYLQHLWFLVNLLCYTSLFLLLAWISGVSGRAFTAKLLRWGECLPILLVVLLLPFVSIGIYALNKIGFPLYATVLSSVSVFMLMLYLPYFLFGLLLFYSKQLYRKWVNTPIPVWVFMIAAIYALLYFSENSWQGSGVIFETVSVYLRTALSWLTSAFLFALFYRVFQQLSTWGRRISEASYTIYLFHHIVVVALGTEMLSWQIHVIVKYLILCVATFFITMWIHEKVITRNRLLKWIFSGIWIGRYIQKDQRASQSR